MFYRSVSASQVRLASDVAEEFFPNIKGDSYRDDVSWLALMRALLPSRIPADQEAQIRYVERDSVTGRSRAQKLEKILLDVDLTSPYTITVVNLKCNSEDMEKVLDAVRHAGIPDHEMNDPIFRRYYTEKDGKPQGYLMICVNHDVANTVIMTNNMSMSMWHTMQGFARTYFKNLFEEKPATEEEANLLMTLAGNKYGDQAYDTYLELMEKFAAPYDFRGAMIRKNLVNFTVSAKKSRTKALEKSISETNKKISEYQEEIGSLLAKRDKAQTELYGLKFAIEEDTSSKELMDYFLSNNSLIFTRADGGSFNYWVKTYLTYWDQSAAESYISTREGYMYRGARNHGLDLSKFERLLRDIFIDRKVRVVMTAAYRFMFNGDRINIEIAHDDTQPADLTGYMLNPHSMHNTCWGTHSRNLTDALSCGDYSGAVAVTIAAASELNVVDVSTGQFSEWLAESNWACLQTADGKRMTCKEYLETL